VSPDAIALPPRRPLISLIDRSIARPATQRQVTRDVRRRRWSVGGARRMTLHDDRHVRSANLLHSVNRADVGQPRTIGAVQDLEATRAELAGALVDAFDR